MGKHKNLNNKRMMSTIMKAQFVAKDLEEVWKPVTDGLDLEAENVRNPINAGNIVAAGKAVIVQIDTMKKFNEMLKKARLLVEAASNNPYGWSAAANMEE